MKKRWTSMIVGLLVFSLIVTFSQVSIVQARTVKLVFMGPITGPNAAQGIGLRNSFDMAIKEANKSGKFPYQIEMMALDDASDPAVAFSASLKALSDKEVVAGAGHWNSPCALAVIHGFHANKIPYMVCAAVSPKVTEFNYPEITRNCPMLEQEGSSFGKWLMEEKGYKTFSALVDTSDFGQTSLIDWRKVVARHNGKIISEDSFPVGTTDFRPILTKIKSLNPDAIYFASPVMEGALTRSQMIKLDMTNILFTCMSSIADEKYNEVAGAAAEGTVIVKPGFDLDEFSKGIEFKKAYETQNYKEPMGAYGVYAYEAAKILLEGLKQTGPDNKVELAKAIRNMKYEGVLGTTTFDKNGQTELSPITILVSQDGKWVDWKKSKYSTGERKIPAPKK